MKLSNKLLLGAGLVLVLYSVLTIFGLRMAMDQFIQLYL